MDSHRDTENEFKLLAGSGFINANTNDTSKECNDGCVCVCLCESLFLFGFRQNRANFLGKSLVFVQCLRRICIIVFVCICLFFAVHFGPRFPLDFLPLKKYLYLSKIGLVKCFKYNSTTFAHRRYLVEWEMNQSIPMEHISP